MFFGVIQVEYHLNYNKRQEIAMRICASILLVISLLCAPVFGYYGDGGPRTYYEKKDFDALLGRAVGTQWRSFNKIKLWQKEVYVFDMPTQQPKNAAKEGSWAFKVRTFIKHADFVNDSYIKQSYWKGLFSNLGHTEGILYEQPILIENTGNGFAYTLVFPNGIESARVEGKRVVEAYIKGEMTKYSDVDCKVIIDGELLGLRASMRFDQKPSPDDVQYRLEHLLYHSYHLLSYVDTINKVEKKLDLNRALAAPLTTLSKSEILRIFPDWASSDMKDEKKVGGSWSWAYGKGDERRSMIFENLSDSLVMSYRIHGTTAKNQKDVIEKLTKWMADNPYKYGNAAKISVFGDDPWLEITCNYKGKTGADLEKAFNEFNDTYSVDFHKKTRKFVTGSWF